MILERTSAADVFLLDNLEGNNADLLRRAYEEIYIPAFPISAERDSLDIWLECLGENKNLSILIAGHNLEVAIESVLKAIAVSYYMPQSNTGQLSYNAVDPQFRGVGLGRKLFFSRIRILEDLSREHGHQMLDGIFVEVNNPAKVSLEEDAFDPYERLKIYEGWGCRVLPLDYVQPETGPGRARCYKLCLMSYPVQGSYPSREIIWRYLESLYKDCGVQNLDKDPDFQMMSKQLEGRKA